MMKKKNMAMVLLVVGCIFFVSIGIWAPLLYEGFNELAFSGFTQLVIPIVLGVAFGWRYGLTEGFAAGVISFGTISFIVYRFIF